MMLRVAANHYIIEEETCSKRACYRIRDSEEETCFKRACYRIRDSEEDKWAIRGRAKGSRIVRKISGLYEGVLKDPG